MTQVHHQSDGIVWVRVGAKQYHDTLARFETAMGSAMPVLPPGAVERLYDQGIRHALLGPDGVIDGGPVPWSLGDQAITDIDRLLTTMPPPPVIPPGAP